jgi:hypothetical protein
MTPHVATNPMKNAERNVRQAAGLSMALANGYTQSQRQASGLSDIC